MDILNKLPPLVSFEVMKYLDTDMLDAPTFTEPTEYLRILRRDLNTVDNYSGKYKLAYNSNGEVITNLVFKQNKRYDLMLSCIPKKTHNRYYLTYEYWHMQLNYCGCRSRYCNECSESENDYQYSSEYIGKDMESAVWQYYFTCKSLSI
jgi:hypothetical protein